MKKYAIPLLMVLICSYTFAQKVIENPLFEVTNSGILNITKIEFNKDNTKIHMLNKFLPKWWVMFEDDVFIETETEKLHIVSMEGGDFGDKIFMPKSGEKTLVLVFPPLNDSVKKIDYNNEIFGISLEKSSKSNQKTQEIPKAISKWMADEVGKVTKKPLEDYNSPEFFNRSPAKLIGYIKGYDARVGLETGIMYMGNDITREDYPIVVQIHPDGRFEAKLPLTNPVYTYVRFDKIATQLYLEPGQTLAMLLDWNEFLLADRYRNIRYKFKNIQFKGPLATINEDLLKFDPKAFDYNSFQKKLKEQSPEQFKKEETLSYQDNIDSLETYLKNNTITKKASVLLKNKMQLEYATHLFDFVSRRAYEAKKDSLNETLKIPVQDNFYDFLQDINLNDQSLLALDGFGTFVNRFEFSKPISIYPKRELSSFKPEISFKEYLDDENIVISDSDKALKKNSTKKTFKSADEYNKYLEAFSEVYRNATKAYNEKYIQPHYQSASKKISMEKWRLRDSVVKNTFHLEKNLVYDLVKIRALDFDIKRSDSEHAHTYWETLKKDIDHPFLKEEGDRIVQKAFPIQSIQQNSLSDNLNKSVNVNVTDVPAVTKLPEGKATDIFRGIIDSHKGKILFVDFWATSCRPCVVSIKHMKETRKKYENNPDFDFVFITDERSSPLKTYNNIVEEQNLKNLYRLSLDDYNYLRQLFKFNGIPRYVVIDKKGDVINDKFPMHNFGSLLDAILKKHK